MIFRSILDSHIFFTNFRRITFCSSNLFVSGKHSTPPPYRSPPVPQEAFQNFRKCFSHWNDFLRKLRWIVIEFDLNFAPEFSVIYGMIDGWISGVNFYFITLCWWEGLVDISLLKWTKVCSASRIEFDCDLWKVSTPPKVQSFLCRPANYFRIQIGRGKKCSYSECDIQNRLVCWISN